MNEATARYDFVFGPDSRGATPEARAETSSRRYVRSQVQIAFASPEATGRELNASEALKAHGLAVLERVASDGAARIIASAFEPSATLKTRREQLRLSPTALAKVIGGTEQQVLDAETPGRLSPYRFLQRMAEALSLDERMLSSEPGAGGDQRIGTKLRDMGAETSRDERLVAALSEASWVIGRQIELQERLGLRSAALDRFASRSDDYRKKVADRGYLLAARTRKLLRLEDDAPIMSLQKLIEDVIDVPLVETTLGPAVAGATISVRGGRGIAISDALATTPRVLFRRMTLAHELGHLLWDPDDRLEPVQVDRLDDLAGPARSFDEVEGRANAFAASLLAPAAATRAINKASASPSQAVLQMVRHFGISAPAARFHLSNICRVPLEEIALPKTSRAAHLQWAEIEAGGKNTVQSAAIPKLRAGRFATLTRQAQLKGLISDDTAASWLHVTVEQLGQLPSAEGSADG